MTSLTPPKNWQDFEELCYLLWSSKWGPETHKHGRQGQKQDGVDIYGKQYPSNKYSAIQCKGKNGNYGKKLTKTEIDRECKLAKNFKSSLVTFIFATTSPRDTKIQDYCRQLTETKKYGFNVDVCFWDDIEEELHYRPHLIAQFYGPDYKNQKGNDLNLDYYITLERITSFFTRPHIKNQLTERLVRYLISLSYELADNACKHGKASEVILSIKDRTLIVSDNGKAFNPLLMESGSGGYKTLESFKKYYGSKIELNYLRTSQNNKLSVTFDDTALQETFPYYRDLCLYINKRYSQEDYQEAGLLEKFPPEVKTIVVNIISNNSELPISIGRSYISLLAHNLEKGQRIRVYYPIGSLFIKEIMESVKDKPVDFIERS